MRTINASTWGTPRADERDVLPGGSISMSVDTVLVVEDSRAMQRTLQRLFESDSLRVQIASDGPAGLELFRKQLPCAVVLDLKLPGMSGKDLCREFKALAASVPIVVLSANSEVEDKVLLLELGADDYVTKPFSPKELLARVRRAMRRTGAGAHTVTQIAAKSVQHEVLTFGDARIDFTSMEATRAGKAITLTSQEFKLLKFLRGQGDGFARSGGFHTGEINARVTEGEDFVLDGFCGNLSNSVCSCARAAHCAANPGEKLLWAERLGYIVIRAEFQQQNFIFHLGISAEDYDRYGGGQRLEFPAEIFAGHSRKLQIKNHRAGKLFAEKFQTGGAIGSDLYLERVGFEEPLERTLHGAAVFHNQNCIHGHRNRASWQNVPFVRPRRPPSRCVDRSHNDNPLRSSDHS